MLKLVRVTAAEDVAAVRELFAEYARAVDEPCCFEGFEQELRALPRDYEVLILARGAGCVSRVVLDTLPKLRKAIALYRALGFREIAPYLARPTPGAICFELSL